MKKVFDNFGILMFGLMNIVLPTVDVTTDILMIVKLFIGAHGCVNPRWWSEDHKQWQTCLTDPETFCTNRTIGGSNETCERTTSGIFTYNCRDPYLWSKDYKEWKFCRESPTSFCSNQTHEAQNCQFESHPVFGILMMIPFLFNYLICFLTWWRLEKRRKETFLFPLVNMYAQFGRLWITEIEVYFCLMLFSCGSNSLSTSD